VTTVVMPVMNGNDLYDAMQLVFQRRHRNGLTLSSNYVLAHTTWTQPSPNDVTVIEHFDADFDIRHRFVFSANYELPFAQSSSGVVKALLAGWQVNGVALLAFAVHRHQLTGRSNTSAGNDRPNVPAIRPSTTRRSRSGSTSTRSRRNRSTPSATPGGTSCTVRRSGASICRSSRTSGSAGPPACSCARIYNLTNTASFANPIAALGAPDSAASTASATDSAADAVRREMLF
jgi:hypothetical protein